VCSFVCCVSFDHCIILGDVSCCSLPLPPGKTHLQLKINNNNNNNNKYGMVWTGSNWLRVGTSGGLL
jgi:hypothetical protein